MYVSVTCIAYNMTLSMKLDPPKGKTPPPPKKKKKF